MNRDRIAIVADYVRLLASRMRLSDWIFDVVEDPKQECQTIISSETHWSGTRTTIRIHPEYFRKSPEEIRHCFICEMIEIHQRDLYQIASDKLQPDALDRYNTAFVRSVCAMADIVAPLLPLPLVGLPTKD